MYRMDDGWTDERMDDFRDEVYRRFDKFEADVDRRFDKVDREFGRINDRLDGLHKVLIYAALTLGSTTVAGWAAMVALIITRT